MSNTIACHACAAETLEALPTEHAFRAISSDIQVVDGDIQLAVCSSCGLVQKRVEPEWQSAVDAIYRDYSINHQSGGADPYIFNSLYGAGPRADILMRHLQAAYALPAIGRMLDIGCGNGNILRGFARNFPNWKLSGIDSSGRWRESIMGIPGVENFEADLTSLGEQKFDAIVMSHVLEHIPNPAAYLRGLHRYLSPGGALFIAVPDIRQNPIDLFVLDHCTHFDETTLWQTLSAGGFGVRNLRADILGKELVAISQVGAATASRPAPYAMPALQMGREYLSLCGDLMALAKQMRERHPQFAIMGTSTAAAWVAAGLDMQVDCYVDEDPQRAGKQAFGKPIHALANVPAGTCVFIPMASTTAEQIVARANRPDLEFAYLDSNDVSRAALRA